jgi:hypothetical protein
VQDDDAEPLQLALEDADDLAVAVREQAVPGVDDRDLQPEGREDRGYLIPITPAPSTSIERACAEPQELSESNTVPWSNGTCPAIRRGARRDQDGVGRQPRGPYGAT